MAGKWRFGIVGFLCFIFVFFSPNSFASKIPSKVKGPIKIKADKLTFNRDENTYTAQGHVVIKSQKSVLEADKIILNNTTKDVEATGHVRFTDGSDVLTCTHMRLNLLTHLGTIYNGTLKTKKGNYRITAERADRLGPERYRVYKGTFTTCNAKKPAWQFKADKMDVTVEGFAVARGAKFYAGGIPILYSPYLIYPTKRKRQTGFLFPILGGSTNDGIMIGESFFWAISEDKDATFTETYYGDRGFKHALEFRYARTTNSQGQLNLYYIDDNKYHGNRWAAIYRHDEYFKNGFYAKADINKISDNDYLIDFSDDIPGKSATDARREQLLKSKVSFGKNWNKYSFNGEFSYYDDLTKRNNDYTIQRYPYLQFSAAEQPLFNTPLNYNFDGTYAYYYKKEAERLQYADLFPHIAYPFELFKVLQMKPIAGFRETMIWPSNVGPNDEDDFESRGIPDFSINAYTVVQRIFKTSGSKAYKNTIKPEVTYEYIPDISQPDLYWLSPIEKKSVVHYGLTSFLIEKTLNSKGESSYRDFMRFKIYQSYDFEAEEGEQEFSSISAQLDLWPNKYIYSKTTTTYDHTSGDFTNLYETLSLSDKRGDSLACNYSYSKVERGEDTNQIDLNAWLNVTEKIHLIYATKYDFAMDDFIESTYGLVYNPQCWRLDFTVHDIKRSEDGSIPAETQYRVMFTLEGLGTFGMK
ncbi:MAG: hypothetical protein DSY91_03085 [Deltaproteobacteria bacterium]|nr:MAG: hypothetical protein DSY91_03085 [Deltaproteobacteria bacterium]